MAFIFNNCFLLLFLVVFASASVRDNRIQDSSNDDLEVNMHTFQEAAKALLQQRIGGDKEEQAGNVDLNLNANLIGGLVSNLLQSEAGKNLGNMLLASSAASLNSNSNNNDVTSQIISGLANILNQNHNHDHQESSIKKEESEEGFAGINPALIGSFMGMFNNQNSNGKDNGGFDIASLASLLGTFMGQNDGQQGEENIFTYLPLIMNTINSFMGPEAQAREHAHKDHAWALPPIVEKVHLFFDHLMNSELGAKVINKLGGEKFVKIFADEKTGKFRYAKFIELMENHSFRKHWIKLVTKRIADLISFFADPYTQQRVLQTSQFFINSFLQSQGFPQGALLNTEKPVESITSAINHISKKYMGKKYDAKPYVKPFVLYVKDLFKMAQEKGILGRAVDSHKLSDTLADTINLDIIEPIIRVNRAYKFAWKVPKCDKYVMCLVNEENIENDTSSLPALKKALSKTSSMVLSWFLSGRTGTSFWTLYNIIADETNCKVHYIDACHDFHLDELRVTTEYVHNEL